jgi:hypothetical protein
MTPRRCGIAALALLAAGCGSSKGSSAHSTTASHRTSTPTTCLPGAKAVMARAFSISPATITTATSVGTNGNPQCTFVALTVRHRRVAATANLYTGPQPYFILERTEIEASQQFTPTRLSPPPQTITGLGLEAAWFPSTKQLMATDAIKLIDISFKWPNATQAEQRRLAIAMAHSYLKVTKRGEQVAHGYP